MCLQTNSLYSEPVKEDIVCYKVFDVIGDKLKSPFYYDIPWELGKEFTDPRFCMTAINRGSALFSVRCAFHTFKSLVDAQKFSKHWGGMLTIVKCIIPAGSEYYDGWFDIVTKAYASSKLKLVEII